MPPAPRPGSDVDASHQDAVPTRRAPSGRDNAARLTDQQLEPLMAASRTITAIVVRSLASVDPSVTVPQLRVLVMLSSHGLMNLSEVAERLGVNASNASRTCDRLVQAGLIHRAPGSEDRRQVELTLSARGRRLVDSVMGHRRDLLATVVEQMPAAAQGALLAALTAFNAAADELARSAQDRHDETPGEAERHTHLTGDLRPNRRTGDGHSRHSQDADLLSWLT